MLRPPLSIAQPPLSDNRTVFVSISGGTPVQETADSPPAASPTGSRDRGSIRFGFALLIANTFLTACSSTRLGQPGRSGNGARVDIIGFPGNVDGGAASNRNTIYSRVPASPPAPGKPDSDPDR